MGGGGFPSSADPVLMPELGGGSVPLSWDNQVGGVCGLLKFLSGGLLFASVTACIGMADVTTLSERVSSLRHGGIDKQLPESFEPWLRGGINIAIPTRADSSLLVTWLRES